MVSFKPTRPITVVIYMYVLCLIHTQLMHQGFTLVVVLSLYIDQTFVGKVLLSGASKIKISLDRSNKNAAFPNNTLQ